MQLTLHIWQFDQNVSSQTLWNLYKDQTTSFPGSHCGPEDQSRAENCEEKGKGLQFNFAEPALTVDFYPPMEAEVKIFRLHLQRDCIGVSVNVPTLRGQIPEDELAPADWPPCFGPDPSLTGCLWAIQTRNMIAPDGLLPVPYTAS